MRHAHVIAFAFSATAVVMACSHDERDLQPSPGTGYVVETTGAVVAVDQPSRTNEPDQSLDQAAARLAGQICAREVLCHDNPDAVERCMTGYLDRARRELGGWRCSPAASRSREKQCLATIRTEPCGVDFSIRGRLCRGNDECPDPNARMVAPGAALADAGL
jgi:hypothetical protein